MVSTEGLIFGLAAALFTTTYVLVARAWLKDSDNPLAFSVIYSLFLAVFSIAFILLQPFEWPKSVPLFAVLLLGASGVLYGLFDASQFFARKYLEASLHVLISRASPVITVILSILILKEELTLEKAAAVVLIIAGNIVALYRAGGGKSVQKGILIGFGSAALLGAALTIDKVAFAYFPFFLFSLTAAIISTTVVFTVFRAQGGSIKDVEREWRQYTWRIPMISFLAVAQYYCIYRAFAVADASAVVLLNSSSIVFTVIGGILLLHERSNIPRKLVGVVLVVAGVALLTL
jgi:bacterial/archaeal transporter family protein